MKSVVEETDRLGVTRFLPPWVFDPHRWKYANQNLIETVT